MSLTSQQQPFADALVKAFGDFMSSVGGAYVAPGTTAAPGQGPGTPFGPAPVPATPAPVAGWWNPTPAQYAAFAARFVVQGAAISPVADTADATGVFATLPPVTATTDILEYAGYGYGPDGKQRLFHVGKFAAARAACDAIAAATVPGQEDAVVKGAEAPGVEPDAVRLSCMTGLVVFGSLGQATMGGGQTVADVVAILNGQNVTPAGQGAGSF
jgi:hypothetical protein